MIADERLEEMSEMILSYLRKHPDAGDTLEGITRWWLESDRVDRSADEVAEGLELLLEKGLLRRVNCDDEFLYKLQR